MISGETRSVVNENLCDFYELPFPFSGLSRDIFIASMILPSLPAITILGTEMERY